MEDVKTLKTKSERELLEEAKQGNMEAFVQLFEPFRARVYAIACRIVGYTDADDIVMQTFLKAWQALPRFQGRSSLSTWLYRITHNCIMDVIRTRKHIEEKTVTDYEDDEQKADTFAHLSDPMQISPDEEVAKHEIVELVQQALNKLSPEHRSILQMRYTDGMSYNEIASAMGISPGTVMSRLFYAKRKLMSLLSGVVK